MLNKFTTNQIIKYINNLYQNYSGYVAYLPGQADEYEKNNITLTYGEVLPKSVKKLIDQLAIDKQDVFYDLGSGTGKVALQFFLNTKVKKACGIEALAHRHQIAEKNFKKVKQELPKYFNNNRELLAIQENFLAYPITDATIIFTDSLCFSPELITKLSSLLDHLPKLKHIITAKELALSSMQLQHKMLLECSWSQGVPSTNFYFYTKI